MKKLLCALIFCLSFISAFAWTVGDIRDEFGDPTGKKELFLKSANKTIVIRENNSSYILAVEQNGRINPVEKVEGVVRIKVDNSQPFELINPLIFYGYGFVGGMTKEQLNLLANGNIIKLSIPDQIGASNTERFNLTGLKEAIRKANW